MNPIDIVAALRRERWGYCQEAADLITSLSQALTEIGTATRRKRPYHPEHGPAMETWVETHDDFAVRLICIARSALTARGTKRDLQQRNSEWDVRK